MNFDLLPDYHMLEYLERLDDLLNMCYPPLSKKVARVCKLDANLMRRILLVSENKKEPERKELYDMVHNAIWEAGKIAKTGAPNIQVLRRIERLVEARAESIIPKEFHDFVNPSKNSKTISIERAREIAERFTEEILEYGNEIFEERLRARR